MCVPLGEPPAAVTNVGWVAAQTRWHLFLAHALPSSCHLLALWLSTRGLYQTKNGELLKGRGVCGPGHGSGPHHRTWPFMGGNAVLWLHLPGGEAGK